MSTEKNVHPRSNPRRRLRASVAALLITATALVLTACGGSSSSGTSTTAASTSKQGGSNRFASLQACLEKEGITLPTPSGKVGNGTPPSSGSGTPPTNGTAPTGGVGRPGGGFKLPAGVSRAKFQEALKKCGGGGFAGGKRPSFNSSTIKAALTKYSACMRENGVKLPAANTSGNGPVFNTKGIDTTSEAFKNAQKKCQSDLKGAFGAGSPGAAGQAGPPAGGEGGPPTGTEGATLPAPGASG
jgi:hypothetical protein